MCSEGCCSWSVCVCVRVSVRRSVRLSIVLLGNSERETWKYDEVGGMHGFWRGESQGSWWNGRLSLWVRERSPYWDARWFSRMERFAAGLPVLMVQLSRTCYCRCCYVTPVPHPLTRYFNFLGMWRLWGEISVKITQGCSRSIRVYRIFIWVWCVFIRVWSFHLSTHFFY